MRGERIAFIQPRLQGYGGSERYGLALLQVLAERVPVDVISEHTVDPAAVERAFGAIPSGVRFVCDPRCNPVCGKRGRIRDALDRRRAASSYAAVTRPYDLLLTQSWQLPLSSAARRSILVCHFPVVRYERVDPSATGGTTRRLTAEGRRQLEIRRRLDSWTRIVTSSAYAQGWIRRYWDREAEIIHPPVDVAEVGDLSAKKPWILGAGFFSPPNCPDDDPLSYKRQEVLIDAFRQLRDTGLSGWELHLAGHAGDTPEVKGFLDALRRRAEGYPVHLHPNCSRLELEDLYRESALFWHACGHGVDVERTPERVEHFGIVTVEAMAWGCVPIVINRGGQPEIVQHERNGFLWDTTDQLMSFSRRLVDDEKGRRLMAGAAMARAGHFGKARFREQIRRVVAEELSLAGTVRNGRALPSHAGTALVQDDRPDA